MMTSPDNTFIVYPVPFTPLRNSVGDTTYKNTNNFSHIHTNYYKMQQLPQYFFGMWLTFGVSDKFAESGERREAADTAEIVVDQDVGALHRFVKHVTVGV